MPRTFGGIFAFVLTALVATAVGLYIINRVAPLKRVIYGAQAAA